MHLKFLDCLFFFLKHWVFNKILGSVNFQTNYKFKNKIRNKLSYTTLNRLNKNRTFHYSDKTT